MSIIRRPWMSSGGGFTLAQMYDAQRAILSGSDYMIVPVGDPDHENVGRTTVTTVGSGGGDGLVFTYSEAITAFDIPPTIAANGVPTVFLNGVDEYADVPDNNFMTFGDGSDDFAFSVGSWAHITDTGIHRTFMSKTNSGDDQNEWTFRVSNTDKVELSVYDESAAKGPGRFSDGAVGQGGWILIVMTYDGAGGASAMNTVKLMEDGAVIASSATNQALYVAMENQTGEGHLWAQLETSNLFYSGKTKGGPFGPFLVARELTLSEIGELLTLGITHGAKAD